MKFSREKNKRLFPKKKYFKIVEKLKEQSAQYILRKKRTYNMITRKKRKKREKNKTTKRTVD